MATGSHRRIRLVGFVLLAVAAVPVGAELTARVDRMFHVAPLAPQGAAYYLWALVAIRFVAAVALAWLVARLLRAHVTVGAAASLLGALAQDDRSRPRLRGSFSPRAWAASFVVTSVAYLVLAGPLASGSAPTGGWPLLAPWLHTYALPVFAVLSVLVALAWGVFGWVREVEEYAVAVLTRVHRIFSVAAGSPRRRPGPPVDEAAPRRRLGLALDSRPPPLPA